MAKEFTLTHLKGAKWNEIVGLIRVAAHLAEHEGQSAAAAISWRLADALGLISEEAPSQAMGANEPTGRGYVIQKIA